MARHLLRTVLYNKALEALEQHATYQPVQWGEKLDVDRQSSYAHSSRTREPEDAGNTLEHLAQRVDEAIAEIRTLPPEVQAKAMAMRAAIEEFHKVGLTLIVKRLKSDARRKRVAV